MQAFENFVKNNGGIYLQSVKWADVKKDWSHRFYSGFDGDNTRVLSALILERTLPAVGKIWYCPAGAVCDYDNAALISDFSKFMLSEMKKGGAAALFFDPAVELRINGEKQDRGVKVHNSLLRAGFMLNEDASKCLYKAPVQLMLPLKNAEGEIVSPEKLLKSFEKGVRYSVRIGENRGLTEKIFTEEDVKNDPEILSAFAAVMRDTSDRNDFTERDSGYIEHLLTVFGADEMDIMLIYYDKNKDKALEESRIKKKAELLSRLENAPEKKIRGIKEEIESIDKQTEHFNERIKETENEGDVIAVAGGLTVHYNGMSSCLFGGARNILRNNLRASHYFNFRRICRSIELKNYCHDLGYVLLKPTSADTDGTLGECVPREDFEGINAFKKSFGANYTEYIGEYILVADKIRFFAYNKLFGYAKKAQHVVNKIVKKTR
ncbi:MAG: peptidoglycan bridge formation glycyltransferase FemA/FemB family protein [Oscillospiraceae bacterium]|nr:peptidoglycan bridge formation glycyltransferase FemA/FemB family protein [Oscillospiraceae bacterium]